MSWLKKFLGVLTDVLTFGRINNWWNYRGGVPADPSIKDPREGR